MKKERSNKAIYARFAITILVCAALGGVAGFCAAMAGKNLLDSADSLNMALASLGQLWFIPGYVLLLVSTIYYLRGKALLPQAEADDDAFQESDRRLCLSLILSGAAMVWLFIALGINGQTDWSNNQAMWLGDHILRIGGLMEGVLFIVNLVVQLVWVVALQALTVKATKVIHPEKKGNVFDTKFQKDWFRSCDEAEQQQIGQCSYFSFRVMSTLFPIVMLVLFILADNGLAPSGWILLVGGLWMVQLMSYQCMAYILDHGKKKRKA